VTDSLAGAYDLVMFDLDGVVYLGSEAVPAAPESIRAIVEGGIPVAYVTNNASRRAREVGDLLRSLGVPARDEEVLTSGAAAAGMLADALPAGAPILVVGSQSLREEIRTVGLTPVDGAADAPAMVVQGYGTTVGWADLAEATIALRAGARWMATNMDATMPSKRGPVPGNGSMVAALTMALGGRRPDVVVGKPEPALFRVAAQHRGASHALVVGDRLDTDIEGAIRAGMDSLLVLTGVSTALDVLRASAEQRPTHLATDLRGLSKPDDATRVPAWTGDAAVAGAWRTSYDAGQLVLTGPQGPDEAEPVDALRALTAAAWAHPDWSGIAASGPEAADVLATFGLTKANLAEQADTEEHADTTEHAVAAEQADAADRPTGSSQPSTKTRPSRSEQLA
jgi:glycerol-1-phosphatase